MLAHFNAHRQLSIDFDASRQRGIGAIAYHVAGDNEETTKPATYPARTRVQPISFTQGYPKLIQEPFTYLLGSSVLIGTTTTTTTTTTKDVNKANQPKPKAAANKETQTKLQTEAVSYANNLSADSRCYFLRLECLQATQSCWLGF
jgi:hypothetical protein